MGGCGRSVSRSRRCNATVGDFEGNVAKILAGIERAREAQADLVAFPELAIPGYPPEDLLLKPSFIVANQQALQKVAAEVHGIVAVAGFAHLDGDLYNAAAVMSRRRGARASTTSTTCRRTACSTRTATSAAGTRRPSTSIAGTQGRRVHLRGHLVRVGAGGVAVLRGGRAHREHQRLTVPQRHPRRPAPDARAHARPITSSRSGTSTSSGARTSSSSTAARSCSTRTATSSRRPPPFEEDILVVDIDVDAVARERLHDPRMRKVSAPPREISCPEIFISGERGVTGRQPIAPRSRRTWTRRPRSTARSSSACATTVRKNGFEEVFIAISGGIDSALTAAIAVDALGAGRGDRRRDVVEVLVRALARRTRSTSPTNLGIKTLDIPIEGPHGAFEDALRTAHRRPARNGHRRAEPPERASAGCT